MTGNIQEREEKNLAVVIMNIACFLGWVVVVVGWGIKKKQGKTKKKREKHCINIICIHLRFLLNEMISSI